MVFVRLGKLYSRLQRRIIELKKPSDNTIVKCVCSGTEKRGNHCEESTSSANVQRQMVREFVCCVPCAGDCSEPDFFHDRKQHRIPQSDQQSLVGERDLSCFYGCDPRVIDGNPGRKEGSGALDFGVSVDTDRPVILGRHRGVYDCESDRPAGLTRQLRRSLAGRLFVWGCGCASNIQEYQLEPRCSTPVSGCWPEVMIFLELHLRQKERSQEEKTIRSPK